MIEFSNCISLGMHRSVERGNTLQKQHPVRDASLTGCTGRNVRTFSTERYIPIRDVKNCYMFFIFHSLMNIKMKLQFFFVALAFGAYGCTTSLPQGDGSVVEIKVSGNKVFVLVLDKVKSGTVTIPLSSLVEGLDMVQLESHHDAFFDPTIATITVVENYIGVRPIYADNYKLFDRSGKFLRTVSRRGRGPGEYQNSIKDDIIDEKNELIYLSVWPGKIFVYKISGQLLKEITVPQGFSTPIMFLSDDILSVVDVPERYQPYEGRRGYDDEYMLFKFDVNTGGVLEKLPPPFEHLIMRKQGGNIESAQNVQGVFDIVPNYYITDQYDTLYHIDVKRNKILPFFTMEYKFTNARDKPIFFQLNKDLMMTTLKETTPAGYYVEKDLIAIDLKNKTSSRVKIVNDYLGNMDALDIGYHRKFHKGYYVFSIQPEDLMEDIEKRLTERSCTEEDREILKKTLSKLKEGTNNVVFFGKLKEEINAKLW